MFQSVSATSAKEFYFCSIRNYLQYKLNISYNEASELGNPFGDLSMTLTSHSRSWHVIPCHRAWLLINTVEVIFLEFSDSFQI